MFLAKWLAPKYRLEPAQEKHFRLGSSQKQTSTLLLAVSRFWFWRLSRESKKLFDRSATVIDCSSNELAQKLGLKPQICYAFCMTQILEATFDGEVFKPLGLVRLPKNARVQLYIKTARSFLDTAEALELEGPSDWSKRTDEYLYGQATSEK